MFATSNCRFAMAALLLALPPAGLAQIKNAAYAAFAEKALAAAREQFRAAPAAETAGLLGRACFDRAEFATNQTQRAMLAMEGIAAMRELITRDPERAAGHYYLALNLGQLARTKMLGALKIVEEMEREFKTAHDLDELLDFAGPDRNLGELYIQAPGWPTSIGSSSKARRHLERAVELAPEYPGNHLNLLEACLQWNDKKGVQCELKAIAELWAVAGASFTGEKWESCWADWGTRLADLRARAQKMLEPR